MSILILFVSVCRDARELAFQQLQTSLAAKDLELASLQDSHQQLLSEVEELRCVKNRETVNMDYLKNIVLQASAFCHRRTSFFNTLSYFIFGLFAYIFIPVSYVLSY
jgi:hypothetical protein